MADQGLVRRLLLLGLRLSRTHAYSHSAWFFFKIMDISGAEAVVAAASPFIGQGESACLVRPYVDYMTESELHLTMTSGQSSPYAFSLTYSG